MNSGLLDLEEKGNSMALIGVFDPQDKNKNVSSGCNLPAG
jgi:hypothetical protein